MSIPSNLNALAIRRGLKRIAAYQPPEPWGPDGWSFADPASGGTAVVTCFEQDGVDWVHASIAFQDRMPTYLELALLHDSVWPQGYAYQVFAPPAAHVNIHPYALHLWGRLDGAMVLPDFGEYGTI